MQPTGIEVRGPEVEGFADILTGKALEFVADLVRTFRPRVAELLARRAELQKRWDRGEKPDFLPETRAVREGDWTVAPLPADLWDRRVEITGPVDRKMIINALNSGANTFMADFEDSNTPTWENVVGGQLHLRDAVRGTISYSAPGGKEYQLGLKPAVLLVRPRGWHLEEKHVLVDGLPVPGGLFDFGLYFFHNARALLAKKSGPYFYLPKMESHLEARLWNDVFIRAQRKLDIPQGTIKATCLIETMPAVFEMDEILYELREHSAGLNCGRWDYIFSFIKKFRKDEKWLTPDRSQISMTQPFMRAYTQLLIATCHKRNVHAMGGMAAQIPIKDNPEANEAAMAKVRVDKEREAKDGHDGTWVAHPGLVGLARSIFDTEFQTPNQWAKKREDVKVTAAELTLPPTGTRTETGLRLNVNVGLLYLESWLSGTGCVPIHNLMEDAATAEISRAQLWQWLHHKAKLEDGRMVTPELFKKVLNEELATIREQLGPSRFEQGRFQMAAQLFETLISQDTFEDFLTLPAYALIP